MNNTDNTKVILVDENDNITGFMDKLQAHAEARLHRAVSVFVLNRAGEWILQRRAAGKYHSEGLWTNTCCTHPYPGETNLDSACRRLMEEMGLDCGLKEVFSFIYRDSVSNGLTEYEYDHVFTGVTDKDPVINTGEVMEWKNISFESLKQDVEHNPSAYTVWFRKVFEQINQHLMNTINA